MIGQLKRSEHDNHGQSVVEYVVLIAAVVAALVAFLSLGGPFEKSYNDVIQSQGNIIASDANKIFF